MNKKNGLFLDEGKLFVELLRNPQFKKDVKRLRAAHQIPDNGFASEESYLQWIKEYKPKTEIVTVKRTIYDLDEDDKPRISFNDSFRREISSYILELYKLLKKFNLAADWFEFINRYICLKESTKTHIYDCRLTRETVDGIIIDEYVSLHFGATFSLKHLTGKINGETRWKSVDRLQNLMQGSHEKTVRPRSRKIDKQRLAHRLMSKKDRPTAYDLADSYLDIFTGAPDLRKSKSRYLKNTQTNK